MSKPLQILLVEDNPGDADLIQEMLPSDDSGFTVHCVSRLSEAVSHLKREKPDLALLDLDLPDSKGIETVRRAHQAAPGMPIVVMTGHQDEHVGVAAVQGGAQDFLIKGQTHRSQLSRVLRYAVERHCVEEKMRESQRLLRSTLDALSAHIAIIDASGQILTTNLAWRKFSGEHGQHAMRCKEQTNYFDACRANALAQAEIKNDETTFAQGVREVLYGERPKFEMEYSLQAGETKCWFHGCVTPFPYGSERRVVIAHEEITDRKLAQEEKMGLAAQLRHAYKMEAIGTLAGGIAHDFNNILASVLGYVELSLLNMEEGSQLENNLKEVHRAATRAKELVRQILTFARKGESHIQPTQISAIAREASKLIRSTIPTSIDVKLTDESKTFAMAEPTQIHQIFMNLFTNAAQAMDKEGGVLSIHISECVLNKGFDSMHTRFTPGAYLKMTVSDTGIGIPPAQLEKIFDPYYTTKSGKEGTGLGLSVVHGIIRNHGGEIKVRSKIGQGTTFTIYLPLSTQTSAPRIDACNMLPKGVEHILFVDDEPPIAEMNRQRLCLLGYRVTAVCNSPEALRRLMADPGKFDLIITDMAMPRLSGEQLSREAKKIKPNIPIILCTGYSNKISEEKAALIGINALLMKPVSIRDMAETIRQTLDASPGAKVQARHKEGSA